MKSFINKAKLSKMKKLLLILAIGAFVACNDDGADEGTNADTTVVTPGPDTSTLTPAPDTTIVTPDTSATARPDTTK